ncbi:hypothetical protein [Bdellovibrio sp. HCB337]|uniref:hypothetical protein n=1 Tax=Bdellovibrio sp. HCB337 TaxID=3394358 RepID=UPI0039A596DC
MKFLVFYIIRSLAVSILLAGAIAISIHRAAVVPGRNWSQDRTAIIVIGAFVFFVLQMVTMPIMVYRKKSKNSQGRITVEDIHNEQAALFKSVNQFFHRHRAIWIPAIILLLIGIVLYDSFAK